MNNIAADLKRGKMDAESATLFAKHFVSAEVEIKEDDIDGSGTPKKHFYVFSKWTGVDRRATSGYSLPYSSVGEALAARLQRAMTSGALFCRVEVKEDCNGASYISHTDLAMGRTLNSDLKKLGY